MQGPHEVASSTPILDSGVLPPRRLSIRPQALLVALVVGIFLMELLAMAGGLWHEHWPAVFLALFFLAIGVHEIGHLLAGWAVGFHFHSIQIGPLLVEHEYGLMKASFSLDMMYLGYAGMNANTVRKLRRRLLIYIAGGPAASLLSVIGVIALAHLMPASDSALATGAGQFGAISLLLTMLSLVPTASTDGGMIEILLCSPTAARRFISTVALGAQFNRGIRARNWKQTWLTAATYMPDKSSGDFYASWMGYLSASDRKDAAQAAGFLERCLSLTPILTKRFRSTVAQEAFVYSAWFKQDLHLAEKWLAQVEKQHSRAPIAQARIEIALKSARGDFHGAAMACDEAFHLLQQMPAKPYIRALQESWLEWRAEIEERKVSAVVS